MSRGRVRLAAVIAALAIALTGCGAMPTSGDVFAGRGSDAVQAPTVEQLPEGPALDWDPERIVQGFIEAATSPRNNYEIALKYLAGESKWNRGASVQIDASEDRRFEVDQPNDTTARVTVHTTQSAALDEHGIYTELDAGTTDLTYDLELVEGQWRITQAPDGVLLEEGWFDVIYKGYSLYFFDATGTFLVPDRRYFPRILAAGRIADALVNGPNPNLGNSVVSAFPEGTTIQPGSVQIASNAATVSFGELPDLDDERIGRMQAQLKASLTDLQATTVQMSLKNTPLSSSTIVEPAPTQIDTRAFVMQDDKVGYLSASNFTQLEGFDSVADLKPQALLWQPGRQIMVVHAGDGVVYRAAAKHEPVQIDNRPGLVNPTTDPFGYIWSAPQSHPDELIVADGENKRITLSGDLLEGMSAVQAMQISRDGTRLAVAGMRDSHPALVYYPIVRTDKGVPVSLDPPVDLATISGAVTSLSWMDGNTIGVLSHTASDSLLTTAVVGASSNEQTVRAEAVSFAGVNAVSNARLLTSDHKLFTRRTSTWQHVSDDVQILGTMQTSK